jgi:hypothetical protein
MVKTKCTDKQHSGECASGPRILEMDDSIHFTSLSAHVVNAFCVLLFFAVSLVSLIPKDNIKTSVDSSRNVSH